MCVIKTDYDLLKARVEHKFGKKIVYSRDCAALSTSISDATGAQVSETTLKRFWNLVNATISPSKYTLNSLSQYIGYADYDDFLSQKDDILGSEADDKRWKQMYDEAYTTSLYSVENVKSRFYVGYDKSVRRDFTHIFMDKYLDSGKRHAVLVSPMGWGKSSIIAHFIDDYFLQPDGRCHNDILWYFDLESVYHTIKSRQGLDDFYISAMGGVDKSKDFIHISEKYPSSIKGQVFIIMDGISTSKHIDNLVRMVQRYSGCPFVHLIVAMRTLEWAQLCEKLPYEYQDLFVNQDWDYHDTQYTNVTPWSVRERFALLINSGNFNALTYSLLYKSSTRHLFGIPIYLDIFLKMCHDGKLGEIRLLEEVYDSVMVRQESASRIHKFLAYYLCITQYGVKPKWEVNIENSAIVDEYGDICRLLMSRGFLSIKNAGSMYLNGKWDITFTCIGLWDFLIANFWLREDGLSESLFDRIAVHYSNDESLKRRLFSWLIKYAFRENNVDILNKMFDIIDRSFEDEEDKRWLKFRYCDQYRYHPNIHSRLFESDSDIIFYVSEFIDVDYMDVFAGDIIAKLLSRQSCSKYFMQAYLLLMYRSFLHCDKATCAGIYAKMQALANGQMSQMDYMLLFTAQIMNDYIQGTQVSGKALEYIVEYAEKFFGDPSNCPGGYLGYAVLMLDAMEYVGCYDQMIVLCEKILDTCRGRVKYKLTDFYYATALYRTGQEAKSRKILSRIDLREVMRRIPPNMFLFWALRMSILLKNMGLGDRADVGVFNDMLLKFFNYQLMAERSAV